MIGGWFRVPNAVAEWAGHDPGRLAVAMALFHHLNVAREPDGGAPISVLDLADRAGSTRRQVEALLAFLTSNGLAVVTRHRKQGARCIPVFPGAINRTGNRSDPERATHIEDEPAELSEGDQPNNAEAINAAGNTILREEDHKKNNIRQALTIEEPSLLVVPTTFEVAAGFWVTMAPKIGWSQPKPPKPSSRLGRELTRALKAHGLTTVQNAIRFMAESRHHRAKFCREKRCGLRTALNHVEEYASLWLSTGRATGSVSDYGRQDAPPAEFHVPDDWPGHDEADDEVPL